jgi:hypothetical protein
MAKASTRTRKPAKNRARSSARAPTEKPHDDDHVDGCDVDFTDEEQTLDEHLPQARGGVEVVTARSRARRG